MRVIFMGTPEFAVAALARVAAHHDVVCVYTQPPRPAGRGQHERPSPVHAWAQARGIAVRVPKSLKSIEVQAEFAALKADIAVVAAYGLILPQPILDAPRLGCVNIHASLLPRWRGAAPIQRAIMAGDTVSGVTIMQMDAGLDTGAILLRRECAIDETTTAGELHDRLAALGAEAVVEALRDLERGTIKPVAQPVEGVTSAAKIDKAEAKIDFTRPARDVVRHIHGLSPVPGAWLEISGERIKILRAESVDGQGQAGAIIAADMTIACATGAIRPIQLQRAGRAAMPLTDFLRGFTLPTGARIA
ncbi:MAG: methionyl-tRNA formyltransferase [Rhodospirillaceae bacterium]|nr:methionyl-tRNA formyltransferase [Rhodospirillaceae bacterium]